MMNLCLFLSVQAAYDGLQLDALGSGPTSPPAAHPYEVASLRAKVSELEAALAAARLAGLDAGAAAGTAAGTTSFDLGEVVKEVRRTQVPKS